MFKQIALCGKLALIVGIVFLVLGGISIVSEVKSGVFNVQASIGVATLLAGVGALFFYYLKYIEGRAGKTASCHLK